MCHEMPNRFNTRKKYDSETDQFKTKNNRTRSFENMVKSFYQELRTECNIESFYTSGKQKTIDCFQVDGFCDHCKAVLEAMGCYYHFCSCQETRPSLLEQNIERGIRSEKWMS